VSGGAFWILSIKLRKGCPLYYRCWGRGCKGPVTRLSKEQLLMRLDDVNKQLVLTKIEERLIRDINRLGIGPLGFGGKTTALGVKIGVNHRHPASYFVDISVSCWADRRARLIWNTQNSKFKIQN
jgi:fumarate hydratase class I